MKKYIFLLIAFIVFAVSAESQTRSIPATGYKSLPSQSYYKYAPGLTESAWLINGSTYDTILINIFLDKPQPLQWYITTNFAQNAGIDTTVTWRIYGKVHESETYTLLQSTTYDGSGTEPRSLTSSTLPIAVSLTDSTKIIHSPDGYSTENITMNTFQFMRYFQLMYIIAGNDHVGTGVKLLNVEFKIPE